MSFMTRVFSLAAGATLAMSVGMASASTIAPDDIETDIADSFTAPGLGLVRERNNRVSGSPVFGSAGTQPINSDFGASTAAAAQNGGVSNTINPIVAAPDDLSPIPLPAAGWLLLAAFGSLLLTARWRKTL